MYSYLKKALDTVSNLVSTKTTEAVKGIIENPVSTALEYAAAPIVEAGVNKVMPLPKNTLPKRERELDYTTKIVAAGIGVAAGAAAGAMAAPVLGTGAVATGVTTFVIKPAVSTIALRVSGYHEAHVLKEKQDKRKAPMIKHILKEQLKDLNKRKQLILSKAGKAATGEKSVEELNQEIQAKEARLNNMEKRFGKIKAFAHA